MKSAIQHHRVVALIKRVTGALEEVLEAGSFTKLTVLDESFECPDDLADRLLADETGRFEEGE